MKYYNFHFYGMFQFNIFSYPIRKENQLRGADIWMFVEHKDLDTNKWNLVKNTDWRNNMVPIYRNTGLFHILCGYYNKDGFDELSVI